MTQKLKILRGILTLIVLALSLHVAPAFAYDGGNASQTAAILSPDPSNFGKTYGQWSNAWWQWAFSIPVHDPKNPSEVIHPLYDETGDLCGVGQSGPAWVLGGIYNVLGTATHTCQVPEGKALFFPNLNMEKFKGNGPFIIPRNGSF